MKVDTSLNKETKLIWNPKLQGLTWVCNFSNIWIQEGFQIRHKELEQVELILRRSFSLDETPPNYQLFGSLAYFLRSRRFYNQEEVASDGATKRPLIVSKL